MVLSSFLLGTVIYKFIRRAFVSEAARGREPAVRKTEVSCPQASRESFKDLGAPQGPHIEIATFPPRGLHRSNPQEPFTFENDLCKGRFLLCHAPTSSNETAGDLDYGEYFAGKTCRWEVRIQLEFKRPPPTGELFFGIEMENYVPTNAATRVVASAFVSALRKVVGEGLYQSFGDDPKIAAGELEKPQCIFPFWAWDQFIVTPEGEDAPSLTDVDFPVMGYRRSAMGMQEYGREVEALRTTLQQGRTYTFCHWFFSHFVDVVNWQMSGLPLMAPIDFNTMCGAPPVHFEIYAMETDKNEKRHLLSRKIFFFHVALWTSSRRPPQSRIDELLGKGPGADEGDARPSRDPRVGVGRMREGCFTAQERSCSDCIVL